MSSQCVALDAATALGYIGQAVLVELVWDDDPEAIWRFKHIVGVVLPVEGVYEDGYFLTVPFNDSTDFPTEIFFNTIRTIRAMRYRDRHGSGNVLGRIARPNQAGSRAALPARRNSSTVPANGSTGAAHP